MRQNRSFWRNKWTWLAAGVVVAVLLFLGYQQLRHGAAGQQVSAQAGDIVEVFVGDLEATASATGRVVPRREADLALGIAGRVEQVLVEVGDEVQAGDPLVMLEMGALARNVATAEQALIIQEANLAELLSGATAGEIAAAEAQVASAQAQLDSLLNGPTEEEIASAQANVDAARANVAAASAQVGQASTGASQAEISAAQQQVTVAQEAVRQAKEAHDRTLECFEGPDGNQVCPLLGAPEQQARANLASAEANLATAQAQLDALLAGPSQDVVSGAQANVSAAAAQQEAAQAQLDLLLRGPNEAQIAAAEATLAQAQASLDALLAGATAERIAVAEAQVEQARIALAEAQENLENATLSAPFDGVVTAVYVAEGELASGVAVQLVDTSSFSVVLDVDEVDIGGMEIGQPAVITLESWPDVEIESEVSSIAPQASSDPGSQLVTYEVHLDLGQTDLPVRAGMTANANLVTGRRENVLLLPNAAINANRSAGTFTVNLVRTDAAGVQSFEEVPVTIGLRDASYTQITSGLEEGDRVLIGNQLPVQRFGPPDGEGGGGPFGPEG